MGEVWRAKDTRLDRAVAIKVLPAAFAENEQLRARFEREARAISQLNHPHVCTLFDVGEAKLEIRTSGGAGASSTMGDARSQSLHYLVMELLEGESLADRLRKGPLPLHEVLRAGSQIAQALAAAHREGITHRDIKPGNIVLTKSGAKLLDFGLAKGDREQQAPIDGLTDLRTEAKPLTQEGTILGTFQYMAPEQLEGAEADARTDIFALGAVLYEMATGTRAFDGKTKTSLIAAIVSSQPAPLSQIVPMTPPALDHVIRRCLEKNPDDRWQSAHDVATELRWISEAGSQAGIAAPVAARKRSRERLAWTLVGVLVAAAAAGIALVLPKLRRASQPFVSDIAAPRGARFNAVGDYAGPLVLSPDGTMAVFSVLGATGNHLMLRSLITGETKALGGTNDALFPFWSPDSRKIGFFTLSKLMTVEISGGAPVPICDVANARGASWGTGDTIVFTRDTQSALFRVPAAGGTPVAVTKLDVAQHTSHRWPSFLPDGKRFLYLACDHRDPTGSVNAIFVGSVDGADSRMILRSVSNAVYADGYLLFSRGQSLMAQKVTSDLSPDGEPKAIAENAMYDPGIWRGAFSVSNDGRTSWHSGPPAVLSKLLWMDRHGTVIGTAGEANSYWDLSFSPDRRKLLVGIGDPQRDTWIQDLERNNSRTKILVNGLTNAAVWAPDGSSIYFDVTLNETITLISRQVSGSQKVLARRKTILSPRAVTPDGKSIILETDGLIERLPIDPPGEAVPMVRTGVAFPAPALSPNGKWLAYASSETGRVEIFVISMTNPDLKWQVSSNGGQWPRWRSDGKELYFVDTASHLMAASVMESGGDLTFDVPAALFSASIREGSLSYDVTADGQKFLVNVRDDHESPTVVILNDWKTRLGR